MKNCRLKHFAFWAGLAIGLSPAAAHAANVSFEWNPNAESDLAGYRLFRSPHSLLNATTAQAMADPLVTKTSLGQTPTETTVTGLALDTSYYFRLTAFDTSGNESYFNMDDSDQPSEIVVYLPSLDVSSPTVSLTSPANGAAVSGTVAIAASASDDAGVEGVQFQVNGANLGAEDITPPYAVSWNTTGLANGNYTLTATARDAVGNSASAGVTVTVNNTDIIPPVITGAVLTVPVGMGRKAAEIRFTTNEAANARIEYGVNAAYGLTQNGPAGTRTSHAIQLAGLTPGTEYHFRVIAQDAAGNPVTSADQVFKTLPLPACAFKSLQEGGQYLRGSLLVVQVSVSGLPVVSPPGAAGTLQLHFSDGNGAPYGGAVTAQRIASGDFVGYLDTANLRMDAVRILATYTDEDTAAAEVAIQAVNELILNGQTDAATKSVVFTVPDTNPGDPDMTLRVPLSAGVGQIGLRQYAGTALSALGAPAPDDAAPIAAVTLSVPGRPNVVFSKPVPLTVAFPDIDGADGDGDGVPDGDGVVDGTGIDERDLRVYWQDAHAGEWKIAGGQVDVRRNSVTALVNHFSTFALMKGAPAAAQAAQKFLSPVNPDGVNDHADFGLDAVEVDILDAAGRRVFRAATADRSDSAITWTCRDENGRLVPSGAYIAKIQTKDGRTIYQTLIVAK